MLEKHKVLAAQIAEAVTTAKEIEADGGSVQPIINGLRNTATLVDLRIANYAEAAPVAPKAKK